jgi:hypothetical protein
MTNMKKETLSEKSLENNSLLTDLIKRINLFGKSLENSFASNIGEEISMMEDGMAGDGEPNELEISKIGRINESSGNNSGILYTEGGRQT